MVVTFLSHIVTNERHFSAYASGCKRMKGTCHFLQQFCSHWESSFASRKMSMLSFVLTKSNGLLVFALKKVQIVSQQSIVSTVLLPKSELEFEVIIVSLKSHWGDNKTWRWMLTIKKKTTGKFSVLTWAKLKVILKHLILFKVIYIFWSGKQA